MAKSINLTGQVGKTYNLDELSSNSQRLNSSEELIVQIWMWNPELKNSHAFPDPKNPKLGQIWLSKFVEKDSDEYKELANIKDGDE